MELYLIRHGETLFNQLKLVQGWCDSPLTELGIQQAQKAREILKNIKLDAAYSSTSERVVDTCKIALGEHDLPIHKDKRIKELNFGIFEGSLDAYKMHYAHKVNVSENKGFYEDLRPVGGEDTTTMLNRFNECVNEIYLNHKNDAVLLASHGVALTAFVLDHCKEEAFAMNNGKFFFIKNAAVTKMIIDDDGYHLVYLNKEEC